MTTASGIALVIGASGGIGSAIADALRAGAWPGIVRIETWSRATVPGFDIADEDSIRHAADALAKTMATHDERLALVFDATGVLHDAQMQPEKSMRSLDPDTMARAFRINAIGPALLIKHVGCLLPRDAPATFVTLSAKVGSIGDNRIGGWYAYRASKAALNQIVRTAAIEWRRTLPQAVLVALHPGTVDTPLSAPFAKTGLAVQKPQAAAMRMLATIAGLDATASGSFIDADGASMPW